MKKAANKIADEATEAKPPARRQLRSDEVKAVYEALIDADGPLTDVEIIAVCASRLKGDSTTVRDAMRLLRNPAWGGHTLEVDHNGDAATYSLIPSVTGFIDGFDTALEPCPGCNRGAIPADRAKKISEAVVDR